MPESFLIKIQRKRRENSDLSIRGDLLVNGAYFCRTLELPWRDNKPNISCIPKGTYGAFVRKNSSIATTGWAIQINDSDLPGGRSAIIIHQGNDHTDTKGCILVGHEHFNNPSWPGDEDSVNSSQYTLGRLRGFFEHFASVNGGEANVEISVEITEAW